jgi:membrane protein
MPSKREATMEELRALGEDLQSLATTLSTDPKEQQRKEIGWRVLYGGLGAAATLVARKLATKSWGVLTGEAPPTGRKQRTAAAPAAAPAPGASRSASRAGTRPREIVATPPPTPAEERAYEERSGRPIPDEAPTPQPERSEPPIADPGLGDLSRQDWIAIFKRAGKETLDDNIPMIASALAYASFFAIPSVLLVVVGLFTLIASPETITRLMDHFATFMPGQATSLLNDSLQRLDAKPSTGILMTVVGLVLALWSTTGAMNSYMTALNIAYDRKDRRPFVRKRLVALVMVACIGFAFVLIAVLLIFGPTIQSWVGRQIGAETAVGWLWWVAQWPLLVAGLLAAFATMYWLGPDVDHPRWRFLTIGSGVAVGVWLAVSGLFAVYTSMFASYNKTWGSLSAVIVMMTWLWLTGLALLFGAEVNAEAERSRKLRSRPGVAAGAGV